MRPLIAGLMEPLKEAMAEQVELVELVGQQEEYERTAGSAGGGGGGASGSQAGSGCADPLLQARLTKVYLEPEAYAGG